MLSDLKIGAKLGLAFAAMLVLMAALGGWSVSRLGTVHAATVDIATNWLPATRDLGGFRAATNAERRAEAIITLATDPTVFAAEEKSLKKARDDSAAAWASYLPTVTTEDERQLVAAITQAQRTYREVAQRAMDAAHKGDNAAAFALYRGEGRQAFNALADALEKDVAFQTRGSDAAYRNSEATLASTRTLVIALVVGAIVVGSAMAVVITRSITRPLREAVRVAETVASGDLTSRIESKGRDETGQLLQALRRMNASLVTIVGEVRDASESIATGSTQIATGNHDLSQRTEEQASNLQQTAASMEQLSATVRQNADAAQQARQLARHASDTAARGDQVVGQVVATMERISTSSRRIADIIGVIDGIAFQTNILALNAAVEAARAGEQGRGFAVVAGEVRTLAQRSANAAKEIKGLIGESVDNVETGCTLVSDAGSAISDIVTQVRRVNDLIGEISAASDEQSKGIGQVGDAVSQLDQVTQQNAALVEESAAASESLKHQAEQLAQTVTRFRLAASFAAAA